MTGQRILVVDDDPWILRMVSSSLVKYPQYHVDVAKDGIQALAAIKLQPPSLIVTDIMMPNMDGWALAKAVREQPGPQIPLLFLSALGPDPKRLEELGLSEQHHISKPFRFQELETRIAQLVAESPVAQPANAGPDSDSLSQGPSALDGFLEQLGLSSLLVMMEMERKDGILTLQREEPSARGQVYLREGRVVSASVEGADSSDAKQATYEMLAWNKGRFSFEATGVEIADEVELSTTGLLMESARLTDEAAREA